MALGVGAFNGELENTDKGRNQDSIIISRGNLAQCPWSTGGKISP